MGEIHPNFIANESDHKPRRSIQVSNVPMLTPALRSSASFSGVLTFGPIAPHNAQDDTMNNHGSFSKRRDKQLWTGNNPKDLTNRRDDRSLHETVVASSV